jgi:hypothetical protein
MHHKCREGLRANKSSTMKRMTRKEKRKKIMRKIKMRLPSKLTRLTSSALSLFLQQKIYLSKPFQSRVGCLRRLHKVSSNLLKIKLAEVLCSVLVICSDPYLLTLSRDNIYSYNLSQQIKYNRQYKRRQVRPSHEVSSNSARSLALQNSLNNRWLLRSLKLKLSQLKMLKKLRLWNMMFRELKLNFSRPKLFSKLRIRSTKIKRVNMWQRSVS